MANTLTPSTPEPGGRIELIRDLAEGWWLFVLRGVVAIAFGVVAMVNPLVGLAGLLGFIAAWMLVDGLFTLWQAITGPAERHGIWFWLDGLVSLLGAAVIFLLPGLSSVALVVVAGAWWAVTGLFEIVAAFRRSSLLLGFAGLASLVFGVLVLAMPGPGLLVLVWLAAIQAVVFGALLITLGMRLRRVAQNSETDARTQAEDRALGARVRTAGASQPAATDAGAIAPTGVPKVGGEEPRPANDPGARGRGAA